MLYRVNLVPDTRNTCDNVTGRISSFRLWLRLRKSRVASVGEPDHQTTGLRGVAPSQPIGYASLSRLPGGVVVSARDDDGVWSVVGSERRPNGGILGTAPACLLGEWRHVMCMWLAIDSNPRFDMPWVRDVLDSLGVRSISAPSSRVCCSVLGTQFADGLISGLGLSQLPAAGGITLPQ